MSAHSFSPQQKAIMEWVRTGRGNARVDAVAGAGKTTTLLASLPLMAGYVFYGQFAKKNALEASSKMRERGLDSRYEASTFHSAGFAALKSCIGKKSIKVEFSKTKLLYKDMFGDSETDPFESFVIKSTNMAKQRAFGVICQMDSFPEWYSMIDHFGLDDCLPEESGFLEEGIVRSMKLLKRSSELFSSMIDAADMLWAPLVLKAKTFKRDWVLIDEAQDTSPMQRLFAASMMKPSSRLIAVGDPRQGIYGFTGADSDAMDQIEAQFSCTRLPLTVSYRCPKAVVRLAQKWVSHIEAHPSAPEGKEEIVEYKDFLGMKLDPTDYIICRYNKPIVELAYSFLKRKIPCRVEGRDIGKGLIALTKKWKVKKLSALISRLEDYLEKEHKKLMDKGQEARADALADRVESLLSLADGLVEEGKNEITDLVSLIEGMFSDHTEQKTPIVTLMSSHKSKGLETRRVFWLGPDLYNKGRSDSKEWQKEQEQNLCYVTVTRAKETLVTVNVTQGGNK